MSELLLALERSQDVGRQWFEERIGYYEVAFGNADSRLARHLFRQQPKFGHRPITVAKHQDLAWLQFGKVTREIGFCVVDVDPSHNYIVRN
jgi:hypothetical protein